MVYMYKWVNIHIWNILTIYIPQFTPLTTRKGLKQVSCIFLKARINTLAYTRRGACYWAIEIVISLILSQSQIGILFRNSAVKEIGNWKWNLLCWSNLALMRKKLYRNTTSNFTELIIFINFLLISSLFVIDRFTPDFLRNLHLLAAIIKYNYQVFYHLTFFNLSHSSNKQ